ncbi:MAG: NAD-binding protein [Burkholderiales bacterium]|nr:NAD-binding protein [Burkholderiales bacterium]
MIALFSRAYFLRMLRNPSANFRAIVLLSAILLYGTTGFLYFELPSNPDLSWSDGLWYSLVTMTTIGYGDFFPKTNAGRYLVGVPLMLFGIGLLGYLLSTVAAALVAAKTREIQGMSSFRFEEHLVIINYSGLPKVERVLDELLNDSAFDKDAPVVLIDADLTELPPELIARRVHFVRGNPTRDETLARAGIDKAKHAVILSKDPGNPESDNLNVSITLAIEARSKSVNSVVECVDASAEELLRKAGCDSIVCNSRFDAHFISQELLNPGMQDVIDELTSTARGQQLYFTPVAIQSPVRFGELAKHCRERGHLAMGIQRGKEITLNAAEEAMINNGDRVITMGTSRLKSLSL